MTKKIFYWFRDEVGWEIEYYIKRIKKGKKGTPTLLHIKRLVKPDLGFGSFHTAWRTLRGYEIMNAIRKGQLTGARRGNIASQNRLIAQMLGVA